MSNKKELQLEALHSSHIALDIFNSFVSESEFVRSHQDLIKLTDEVSSKLYEVYQAIAAKNR